MNHTRNPKPCSRGRSSSFPAASIRPCARFAAWAASRRSSRAARARTSSTSTATSTSTTSAPGVRCCWATGIPAILEALAEALEIGTSFGAPTEQEIELAEAIRDAVPSIEMVRLVNSGTEATMSAIRAGARLHRARPHRQVRRLLSRPRRFAAGEGRLGRGDARALPDTRGRADERSATPPSRCRSTTPKRVEQAFRAHGDRDRGRDRGAGGGQHGLRAARAGVPGSAARAHRAARRAADLRRSDDGLPRGLRRRAAALTASGRT